MRFPTPAPAAVLASRRHYCFNLTTTCFGQCFIVAWLSSTLFSTNKQNIGSIIGLPEKAILPRNAYAEGKIRKALANDGKYSYF